MAWSSRLLASTFYKAYAIISSPYHDISFNVILLLNDPCEISRKQLYFSLDIGCKIGDLVIYVPSFLLDYYKSERGLCLHDLSSMSLLISSIFELNSDS